MKRNNLAGTYTLLRFFLRRDRFWLLLWVLLPLFVTLGQVKFVMALPDWGKFIAELSANPLTGSFLGPVVPLSLAGAIIWRSSIQGAMIVAIGSMLTVIRHTRTEEEKGRSELVRGGMVGRHANLTAALLMTCLANLMAGILAALGLLGNGLSPDGSLLFGLTIAASGWFFSGVGAVSAQLRENAGGARGIAMAVLGVVFLLFIRNNVNGGYTGWAWFTPMAWYRLTQPFAGNHYWVLLVFVFLTAVPAAVAYTLAARRDLGSALFKPRLGPAVGSPGLNSPLALAWRLHKGVIISWTVGVSFIGAGIGAVVPIVSENISDMLANMGSFDWLVRIGNREAFMAVVIYIVSVMAGMSVYAIAAVLRLRKEETEGLAEPILAKAVSRMKWMSSHLIIAFAGSAFLQIVLGLAAGLGWGLVVGDAGSVLPRTLGMAISKIPVIWVMAGIAAMVYGLLPRVSSILSWSFLVLFIIIEMTWEAQVIDWSVMRLIPFSYVHYTISISELSLLPLFGLTGLAVLFTGVGLLGFNRRSIG
ncbi:MAG: ABC transporter permease [Peptococcaceae bacterium]